MHFIHLQFGEHLILGQPVPTTMTDLRNDMAVQLLNASGMIEFCTHNYV